MCCVLSSVLVHFVLCKYVNTSRPHAIDENWACCVSVCGGLVRQGLFAVHNEKFYVVSFSATLLVMWCGEGY